MRSLTVTFLSMLVVGCGGRIEAESADGGADVASPTSTSTSTGAPTSTPTSSPTGGTDKDAGALPPPPPPCSASGFRASDVGAACFDDAHWREVAADACEFKGGVASLRLDGPCGVFSYRTFRCCGADGACTDHRDGGPSSCKDEATWRKYSVADCTTEGRTLATFSVDTPCGPGGALGATYQCCKP